MAWFSLLPRDTRFFQLIHDSAKNLSETAGKLVDLMEHYDDVPVKVEEIKRLEHVGDESIHNIMSRLHRTFVTPIDREDIANLAERIDDVVDAIEEAARHMVEYRIESPKDRAREMAVIIFNAAAQLQEAIGMLGSRGSKLKDILPYAVEINRLENEADQVTSRAVAELFESTSLPTEVLKWREIYGYLEEATDRCEDAANVLEAIVLKHG